ncbi:MAG: methyltransferase domain-containing protein [Motiliproteus sp.]
MTVSTQLRCPLCARALHYQERGLRCTSKHSFDQARQGYFHLLPVQNKRSKAPGDSAEMVHNRRDFLNLGHYLPIAEKISQLALAATNKEATALLDCGCGEGYYSQHLAANLPPESDLIGLDISKEAVKAACQRNKESTWIVASGANLPIVDSSLDQVVCLFTPIAASEFKRVLKPGGHLIIANTGPDHLLQLREQIYDQVKRNAFDPLPQLRQSLGEITVEQHRLQFDFQLDNNQQILQLLAMTPHQWRASASAREELKQLDRLTLSADVSIHSIKLPC